jgi:hypothetical protein
MATTETPSSSMPSLPPTMRSDWKGGALLYAGGTGVFVNLFVLAHCAHE